jgi:methyl-accepting chemotaxis protein
MQSTYMVTSRNLWQQRWRMFFMACEELFADDGGNAWLVAHYRFKRRDPGVHAVPLNRWLKGGINTKLVKVFVLQMLAISVATVLGVYAAALVVERVLVQEALNGEAEHFWSNYRTRPQLSLPNTNNLRGYMARQSNYSGVPLWLRDEPPGFRRVARMTDPTRSSTSVIEGADRLYLVFDEVQVSALAFYFGIAPLTGVLLLIYILTWVGYVMSRRAVSTVVQLAEAVRNYDFNSGEFEKFCAEDIGENTDTEALTLVNAFNQFINRMESFIQRERNFTRNASHELRTPLAVVKANLDLLAKFDDPGSASARSSAWPAPFATWKRWSRPC